MIIVRLLSARAFMVGFGTTITRVWEPALLWNQLHQNPQKEATKRQSCARGI
jgi:hypothetical protein